MSEEIRDDQSQVEAQGDNQQAAPVKESDYSEFLQGIKNSEGSQKYRSVEDALKGAANAQEHIKTLERENAELRGLKTKLETMEELLVRLEQGKREDQPAAPRIEDTEQLVDSRIKSYLKQQEEASNRHKVLDTLRSKYGSKTEEIMKVRATELGFSLTDLGSMAAKSPVAVLELFKAAPTTGSSVHSTVNTQAISPQKPVAVPPKNLMQGATNKEVISYLRELKGEIEQEMGLT